GQESIKIIRENPYQLAQDVNGIGFRPADEIAVKRGLPRDSLPRLSTGLKYVLAQAANEDGHCFLPEYELLRRAADILQAPRDLLAEAMGQLKLEKDVFLEPPLPQLPAPSSRPELPASEEAPTDWVDGMKNEPESMQRVYFGPFWHAENGS